MSDLLCPVSLFLCVFDLIHLRVITLLCFMWYCALRMCLSLCSTNRKCSQECVSVFLLVNVLKRELISSNVIHTVTSHYFHIAGSPPHSLYPSIALSPFLLPLILVSLLCLLCHPHLTQHTFCTTSIVVSAPPWFPCLLLIFSFTQLLSLTPTSPFITSAFLSLSTLSIIVLPPWWTFSVLLFLPPRTWSHQQKEFKIHISKISTESPLSADSLVKPK